VHIIKYAEVYVTDEYLTWFSQLSEYDKETIMVRIHLLAEFGPELSSPYADTLYGSKMSNLKELRAKTNAIAAMECMMSPEAVQRARIKAEQKILAIKLGQLREKRGLKQNEINNFSQTSVSQLEKR
jgi:hypothetical protein